MGPVAGGLLRPCAQPGCRTLVPYGRCAAHTTTRINPITGTRYVHDSLGRETDQPTTQCPTTPPPHLYHHQNKPFYNSKAWKLTRLHYLSLHPICQRCHLAPSTEVHHKLPISTHPELKLDEGNFEATCKPCHSRETVRQDGGFGRSPQTPRKERMTDMSKGTVVVQKLYTDGRVEDCNEAMDLKALQAFVGGYIEMVPCQLPYRALIVNEEGLIHDLPHNVKATSLVRPGTLVLDMIRGNALLVKA